MKVRMKVVRESVAEGRKKEGQQSFIVERLATQANGGNQLVCRTAKNEPRLISQQGRHAKVCRVEMERAMRDRRKVGLPPPLPPFRQQT